MCDIYRSDCVVFVTAVKFSSRYFGSESAASHPALGTLNRLCQATEDLNASRSQLDALKQIAAIMKVRALYTYNIYNIYKG